MANRLIYVNSGGCRADLTVCGAAIDCDDGSQIGCSPAAPPAVDLAWAVEWGRRERARVVRAWFARLFGRLRRAS